MVSDAPSVIIRDTLDSDAVDRDAADTGETEESVGRGWLVERDSATLVNR